VLKNGTLRTGSNIRPWPLTPSTPASRTKFRRRCEGHQGGDITSQLVKGNPGGVGAGFGLGVALDAST
jgi:hypothetical protein